MALLITGGAGFIGKHLVRRSLAEYSRVIVIDKAPIPAIFRARRTLIYKQGDAYNAERLTSGLKDPPKRIVHLAAQTSVPESVLRPLSGIRSNVGVTCSLLEFARKTDCDSFVFTSSSSVYGEKETPCRESDTPNPQSQYAASKLAAEYYCRVYAKIYDLPVTILRPFNAYGPGQSGKYSGVITSFIKAVSRGRPPIIYGDGKQTRDFIFVEDLVAAIIACSERRLTPGQTLNVGSGNATSIQQLAEKVLQLSTGSSLQPVYMPPRPGDIVHSQADIFAAREALGFKPSHGLENGLRETSKWLRAQKRGD